jgi:hypothetical protein
LSARLNAFKVETPLKPVVSVLHFRGAGERDEVMRVSGLATRVLMDPDMGDALARFAAAGARLAITLGDHTLLLLCLLALPLSAGRALRAVAVLALGQVAGLVLYAAAPGVMAASVPVAAALSASCAIVAALQLVVQARAGYVSALAFTTGVLSGAIFGGALANDVAFAGAHTAAAASAFVIAVIGAELWLGGLFFATRGWLSGVGGAARVIAYGVAAFVAHTALHHFMDAGAMIEQTGSFLATHALVLITLAWAVVMLALAAREALSSHSSPQPGLLEVGSV